jgi:hypothetical protein
MRVGPWTIVALIGFPLYAILGWFHGGGGTRSTVYYAVSAVLLACAVAGIARAQRSKPPQR